MNLSIAKPILNLLENEAKETGVTFALLLRRIIKAQYGASQPRHPGLKPVTFRTPSKPPQKVRKGTMLDTEDAEYLDKLCRRLGTSKNDAIVLIVFQYFGLPIFPPSKGK